MQRNTLVPKTLTVYKASAGSGKTFRLAVEYIKLLIENPLAYENILAVTFTNKATEEMKMRILSQLYGIWKRLPDSYSYIAEVTDSLNITEEEAASRAEKALRSLLHNYHYFKVQTIDTFFQSVLRNLAKELQLNAGLRVGLNNQEVVEQAVDTLIDSLATDRSMMRIVMNYVEDNISEEKSWNVIGQIKKFGETIFEELYKRNRAKMDVAFANQDFFDEYKRTIRNIIITTEEKYKEIGKEVLKKIEENGLNIDDFSYKATGPIGYFLKLSNGAFLTDDLWTARMTTAMDDSSKWFTKTSPKKDQILPFVEKTLLPLIKKIEQDREREACYYKSAKVTLRHINDVRLLRKIEETAHSLNNTAQRFMLSDTQSLLHEMLGEGDASFIYEKIGSRLEHIMIDEFQDTSTVQWGNFKPLLQNCMSQGFRNLIVGDVKQSIYRFRNGDWRLLNDIDKEFETEELEFPPIRTNWRSDMNIINFNNVFFSIIARLEVKGIVEYSKRKALDLEKAYSDVVQDVPKNCEKNGLVHIELLPHEKLDCMQERTLQNILDLIDLGVKQEDIAILVRKKQDISPLATYIEQETKGEVKIVSEEAFRLDASAAVRIIVNAMSLLMHPKDNIALATLVTDYYMVVKNDKEILANAFCDTHRLETLLPESFVDNRSNLLTMSIHDIAENIVRIFSLSKCVQETAYITTFFDCLHDFSSEYSPLLEDFISAWNESISKTTIQAAGVNGIRILTIHKSKGLEFGHVIVPYCNWNGNPPMSIIWTTPSIKPFSELPLIPLDYRQANTLKGTIYEEDGYEEHVMNVVDNLNLLYVAMTRATNSLFVIGERNSKDFTRSQAIYETVKLLPESINDIDVYIDGIEDETKILSMTYGKINVKEKKEEDSSNVFLPHVEPCPIQFNSYASEIEFRQSSESRRFAQDYVDENDRQRMVRFGSLLHQLFARIHTVSDIEPVLQKLELEGGLFETDIIRDEFISSIKGQFLNEQIKDWFSGRWRVFNECCIISPDGTERRPDRVITNENETIVIDFKFGKHVENYKKQVREYVSLLQNMGMPNVKGFIWYVTSSEIESI